MVILKLHSEEAAHDIAYTLRGKRFGQYVILFREDRVATEVAIELADAKVQHRSYPGLIATLIVGGLVSGFLTYQGVVGVMLWAQTISEKIQIELSSPNEQG